MRSDVVYKGTSGPQVNGVAGRIHAHEVVYRDSKASTFTEVSHQHLQWHAKDE